MTLLYAIIFPIIFPIMTHASEMIGLLVLFFLFHLDSCRTPISAYGTPISVYSDIDTDIGVYFNDTRYQCTPDIGVYPTSGIPDIGYNRSRVYTHHDLEPCAT